MRCTAATRRAAFNSPRKHAFPPSSALRPRSSASSTTPRSAPSTPPRPLNHPQTQGFPSVGFEWQGLESPALRRSLGLAPHQRGVLLCRVEPTAPAAPLLRVGDVLSSFDGEQIACDGTVAFRTGERIDFGTQDTSHASCTPPTHPTPNLHPPCTHPAPTRRLPHIPEVPGRHGAPRALPRRRRGGGRSAPRHAHGASCHFISFLPF